MTDTAPAYGLWLLVVLNSAIFILFAFSFFQPQTARDWRSFGAFSAFLVALFTEMYGFPLTIYLLSGWLQSRFPQVDWLSHDAGHLLEMMFGWEANPHFGPFHLLSFALIASLLVMSPGPNGALIAKTVPTSGVMAGFANIAGFVTAFYIHGTWSILGISAILLRSAELFMVVKLAGAARRP